MANVRALNKDKYNISANRFRELYYFCLQYNEWKQKLLLKRNPLKAMQYGERVASSTVNASQTENIAIECAELSRKCEVVENVAKEADAEISQYILYAVTNKGVSYEYLHMRKGIPCGRDRYYMSRRKFYWLLDKRLDENK